MTTRTRLPLVAAAALVLAAGCAPENGPSMKPGSDCLDCHGHPSAAASAGGEREDGPTWTLAGTVYATASGTGDGVRGATIHVTDATGRVVTLHSQAVGNFYLADGLTFPLHVSVERNGANHPMNQAVTDGSCNRCHRPGQDGSIFAP